MFRIVISWRHYWTWLESQLSIVQSDVAPIWGVMSFQRIGHWQQKLNQYHIKTKSEIVRNRKKNKFIETKHQNKQQNKHQHSTTRAAFQWISAVCSCTSFRAWTWLWLLSGSEWIRPKYALWYGFMVQHPTSFSSSDFCFPCESDFDSSRKKKETSTCSRKTSISLRNEPGEVVTCKFHRWDVGHSSNLNFGLSDTDTFCITIIHAVYHGFIS